MEGGENACCMGKHPLTLHLQPFHFLGLESTANWFNEMMLYYERGSNVVLCPLSTHYVNFSQLQAPSCSYLSPFLFLKGPQRSSPLIILFDPFNTNHVISYTENEFTWEACRVLQNRSTDAICLLGVSSLRYFTQGNTPPNAFGRSTQPQIMYFLLGINVPNISCAFSPVQQYT